MAEGFIVRKGGVSSETTAAPTITIIEESDKLIFTLTNNDDNTAIITYEIDDILESIELAAAATSSNITIDTLDSDTYTLTAYATVVGEVATKSDEVIINVTIPQYEELADIIVTSNTTQIDFNNLNITKDDELRLVYTLVGDSSSVDSLFLLQVNNITSGYTFQALRGNGNTISSVRSSSGRLTEATSVIKVVGFADIKVSNNDRFVFQSQFVYGLGNSASTMQQRNNNTINTSTVTSITKLSIVCDRTNGIAVGSRLQLYKVNTGVA